MCACVCVSRSKITVVIMWVLILYISVESKEDVYASVICKWCKWPMSSEQKGWLTFVGENIEFKSIYEL